MLGGDACAIPTMEKLATRNKAILSPARTLIFNFSPTLRDFGGNPILNLADPDAYLRGGQTTFLVSLARGIIALHRIKQFFKICYRLVTD